MFSECYKKIETSPQVQRTSKVTMLWYVKCLRQAADVYTMSRCDDREKKKKMGLSLLFLTQQQI